MRGRGVWKSMRSAASLMVIACFGAVQAQAQPVSSPGGRSGHALVFHEQLRTLVLLGGDPRPHENKTMDLWTWDGARWAPLSTEGPPARLLTGAAFDAARSRIVVFGGLHNRTSLRDTWEWDASAGWRAAADTASPSARDHLAMAFDKERGVSVMFGGARFVARGEVQPPWPTDTWEWNGGAWRLSAARGPAGRARTAMVYDAARGRVLLYGGIGESPAEGQPQPFFDDTWAYDGTAWTQLSNTGPGARYAHAMAYDARAGVVLLYGGATMTEYFQDMWQWDGERWSEIELSGPTPGPRYSPAMAYDPVRGRVVLHGGYNGANNDALNDVWEWDGLRWHDVTPR